MVRMPFDSLQVRMVDTILVVEDEPDVVDLVRYHLRRAGFDVLTALNGPAGLATATQSRPDAIVLDIMLPQMTGHRSLQSSAQSGRNRGYSDPDSHR